VVLGPAEHGKGVLVSGVASGPAPADAPAGHLGTPTVLVSNMWSSLPMGFCVCHR
jgi:hypothetical protein